MSAVYSLSGVVDGVPSAESVSGENIAPSAGPTPPLVADETTSKGPHVPWQVMKGDDSQIEVTDSTPAGKNRNKSAVVRPAEMPARIPEPKELKNTLLNSKAWRDSVSLLEMRKKSSLSKQSESANRGSKSSFKNTGTTEEVSSGVMSDFEREEEHKKSNEANLRPVEGNKQLHAEKVEERKPANLKTVHASVLQRPLGALVGGKVGDFMGSHLEDGSSMVRGQNITRLSYALYKVVRLFNLKRLIDFPAGAHVGWMPEMVTRFEYDIPGFVYEGLDTTDDRLDSAKVAADLYGNAEFRVANPEVDIPVDSGDMLLVWNELDGERSDPRSAEYASYIINVVKAAKKANIAYITFGQYPRLRGVAPIYSKGRWRFIGKSKEEVRCRT